jgi:DUF917 family protein
MQIINTTDLKNMALGATVLGCGGGGDPYLGRLVTEQVLSLGKTIQLIDLDELADTAVTACVGYAGSPAVDLEKLLTPEAVILAIKALAKYFNVEINALAPIEIGGGNALVPLFAAGVLGIPVVNGDGMGRAFPQVCMTTYSIYGDLPAVAAVANDDGYVAMCCADTPAELEKLLHEEIIKLGGSIALAQFPMDKELLRKLVIPNTLSIAKELGKFIRHLDLNDDMKFNQLCDFFTDTIYKKAKILFSGKIIDLRQWNNGRYITGEVELQSATHTGLITFQNENLIFRVNNQIQSMAPDLIVLLDQQTAEPLLTTQYRYGQHVTIIEISAPDILTTPRALEVLRPKNSDI